MAEWEVGMLLVRGSIPLIGNGVASIIERGQIGKTVDSRTDEAYMRRVRRAVKPPPFQGGNHEFKSHTRHHICAYSKIGNALDF